MDPTIFKVEKLRKEYLLSRDNRVVVIPELDLEIRQGEFLSVMGNSGSGKSTLLYLLGGLDRGTGGEISFRGTLLPRDQKQNALLRRSAMGFIFQQHNLVPSLTLLENILVAAFLVRKNRAEAREKALHLMNELGIEQLQKRYPSQVSGGEQQRCSIARALVNDPDILLADEPTGSLNSSATLNVLNTFRKLHENGQTVVLVTHEVEAACYGQRVIYLQDGRIVDALALDTGRPVAQKEQVLHQWLMEKGW